MNIRRFTVTNNRETDPPSRTILLDSVNFSRGNRISTKSFTLFSLFSRSFLDLLKSSSFIWFLFQISIELTTYIKETSLKISILVPFILIYLTKIAENLVLLRSQSKHDKIANNRECAVYSDNNFNIVKFHQVLEGDIVLVNNDNEFPVDGLILASEDEEGKVYISKSHSKDKIKERSAIKETQQLICNEGINLTELKKFIEWVKVPQGKNIRNRYDCNVKFKGNPRIFHSSKENFVVTGSKNTSCQWVIFLAVYVGHESNKWWNFKKAKFGNITKSDQIAKYFHMFHFFLMLFYIVANCLIGKYHKGYIFGETVLEHLFYSIVIFGNLVSVSLYLSLLLCSLVSVPYYNFRNEFLKISNSSELKELALTEYLVTEKTGICAEKQIRVQAVQIGRAIYSEDPRILNENIEECESDREQINSFKSEETHETFSLDYLKEILANDSFDRDTYLFALSLLLCKAPVFNIRKNNIDNILTNFAETLGLSIISQVDDQIDIQFNEEVLKFSLVLPINFNAEKQEFKAGFKNMNTGEIYIFYRITDLSSELDGIKEQFSNEEGNLHQSFKGFQKVFFLYKILDEAQANLLENNFSEIYSFKKSKIIKQSSIFNEIVRDMEMLAVVGYENYIDPETVKAVESLKEYGIKIWIGSAEEEKNCISSAYYLNLIEENTEIINFSSCSSATDLFHFINEAISSKIKGNETEREEKEKEIKNTEIKIFRSDKRNLRKENSSYAKLFPEKAAVLSGYDLLGSKTSDLNFCICLNSKVLKLALESREIMKHLVILLFCARTVIASSLDSSSKRHLVKIIKKFFSFKPVVMAVGRTYYDYRMINKADIGVAVSNNAGKKWIFSDFCIEKFSDLEKLILSIGQFSYGRVISIIYLVSFKESFLITLLFLYQMSCSFSATPMISYDLFVIFELFLSVIYIISISSEYKVKDSSFFIFRKNITRILLCSTIGIFQGIVLFFFIILCLSTVSNSDGMTEDYETTGLVTFILINFTLYSHCLSAAEAKTKSLFITFLSLCLLAVILAVTCSSELGYSLTTSATFLNHSNQWLLICLYPFISYSLSYIYHQLSNIIERKSLKSRLEEYRIVEKVFSDKLNWKVVKEHYDFEINKTVLKFNDKFREKEYTQALFKQSGLFLKILLVIFFIFALANNILIGVSLPGFLDFGIYTMIVTIFSFVFVLASFFLVKPNNFIKFELTIYALLLVFSITETFVNTKEFSIARYPVFACLFSIIICTGWVLTILKCVITYLVSIMIIIYETFKIEPIDLPLNITQWAIIMPCILTLILISNYSQEKTRRKEFTLIKKAEIEVEKYSTILAYLLPDFVRKRVKDGVRYISEDKGTVSVIFCDIYEFDKIMKVYSPKELTVLLNELFGRIDSICETYGIAKIETVGKTYLACAGLKDSEKYVDPILLTNTHARRAIDMALTVIKEGEKIILKDGSRLKFKIGINSGPVTAGVVGFHKPQFSLVGDTVNTSSRMASTLTEVNAVQISASTYDLIGDSKELVFKDCQREVKGKGSMNTKIVSYISMKEDDNSSDEVNIQKVARNSSFNLGISLSMNNRPSDLGSNSNQRVHRNSLLASLGVNNTKELVRKQTNQKINNIFNFLCAENESEKEFRITFIKDNEKAHKLGLAVAVVCNILLIIAESIYLILKLDHSSLARLLTLVIGEPFIVLALIFKSKHLKSKIYSFSLSAVFTLMFISIFISNFYANRNKILNYMYFIYLFLLINFFSGNMFAKNIYFNFIVIPIWIYETTLDDLSLTQMTYTLTMILIVLFVVFTDEKRMRENTILKIAAEKEVSKTDQLLTQMMPPTALSSLEKGNQVMERLNHVTVMFADIVGFTAWSSVRSPTEVVNMLSELFTRFDKMCVENCVYKVHTIGDCYVAMGYVNDKNMNPAREAVNMITFATSLISLIKETNEKCGIELGMRIGMHTGQITGGITGTKIVRYDIYGQDVQIANKMESNGEAGKIAVSQDTKELIDSYLPGEFEFSYGKDVGASSGAGVKLYFYEGSKSR